MKVLFKHELKNHFWEIVILSSINILICVLFGIYLRFFDSDNIVSTLILGGLTMSFIGVFIATGIVFIVSVIKSFNTKLFTNEGYLTFVLPVSLDKLLIVKYLVNLLWVIIIGLSYIIGILILFLLLIDVDTREVLKFLLDAVKICINSPLMCILIIIENLTYVIFYFSVLFFVLAILNCGKIKKGKFILGIALYMVITRVINFISTILSLVSLSIVIDETGKLKVIFINVFSEIVNNTNFDLYELEIMNINSYIIIVASLVGLYLLARFIINKKLELE